jgi:RHS repeat-associated protein
VRRFALVACILTASTAALTPIAVLSSASPATAAVNGDTIQRSDPAASSPDRPADSLPAAAADGELLDRRTATSRTFVAERGLETRIWAHPVNVRDQQGKWQKIDTTLVADKATGEWRTSRGVVNLRLPKTAAEPVEVANAAGAIRYALQGAQPVTPTVDGAVATYREALPAVDVRATAIDAGLKEDLILRDATAARSFTWTVSLPNGWRLVADGPRIIVRDAGGVEQFVLPAPNVQDSSGDPRSFSTAAVAYALDGTTDGARLTVTVDPVWLAAPGRVWPVIVDPSNIGANPSQTTFLNQAAPTTNYAGSGTLKVGSTSATPGVGRYHALMKFDLSSIPRQVDVIDTNLTDDVTANSNPGSTVLTAQALSRSWTTGATWNTYNGVNAWTAAGGDTTGASKTSTPVTTSHPYVDVPLTAIVQGWYDTPSTNHGVVLSGNAANTVLDIVNNTGDPYLSVNYFTRSGSRSDYATQTVNLSDRSRLAVNLGSGNLQLQHDDLKIAGIDTTLQLSRFYDSQGTSRIYTSPFPGRWSQSPAKDMRLLNYPDGQVLLGVAGSQFWFANNGSGGYITPPAINADLTAASGYPSGYLALRYRSSGQTVIFGYYGLLHEIKDRNGNKTSYDYSTPLDSNSTLATVTDTRGRVVTLTHRSDGRLTTLTDSSSRTWSYGYDSSGNYLTSFTDPAGAVTTYGYNSNGLLSQISSSTGRKTNLTYDSTNRVTSIMRVTSTSGTDTGPTTTFTYTDTTVSYTDSTGAGFSYPGKTVVTDANSYATTHYYDSRSRVTRTVDALGHTRSKTYNANSDVTSAVDALGTGSSAGNNSTSTYDTDSRATGSAAPTGAASSLTYAESAGTITNPVAHWQPATATDPNSNQTTFTYDGPGNLTKALDTTSGPTGGAATTYAVYGNTGVASCGGRTGQTGQVCSATDPRGQVTSYAYNSSGELATITPPSPLGATNLYYDGMSRLIQKVDGKGQSTRYTYGTHDRISYLSYGSTTTCTSTDISAGNCIDYYFDNDGNPTSFIEAGGTTTYTYDKLSRETARTLPSASSSLTYDNVGNVLTATDSLGTTTYAYNDANQLTSLAEPGGSCTSVPTVRCTTFTYDNNGARLTTTYPTSPTTTVMTSTYDNSGRISRIKAVTGATTHSDFTYTYLKISTDTALTRSRVDNTAGLTTTYDYDTLARLTGVEEKNTSLVKTAEWTYAYDLAGNRTAADLSGTVGSATTSFGYNNANQLTSRAGSSTGWSYDANGNETSAVGATTRTSETWNAKDQLTSTTVGGTATAYTYSGPDQNRRLTAGGLSYRHTAGGITGQTLSGTTTSYTRDPRGTLIALRTGTSSSGSSYYYTYDGLGSVVGLINASGTKINTYSYDPYGISRSKTETVTNPWQYIGGYLDTATGMYKLGIRYYDPTLGRFTQQDPTGQDPHYTYALNSPITLSDPSGAITVVEGTLYAASLIGLGTAVVASTPVVATVGVAAGVFSVVIGGACLINDNDVC